MLGDVLKMKLDEVWVGSTNLSLKSARVSRLAFSSIGDYVFTHNGFLNFIFGNTHLPNSPLLSAFNLPDDLPFGFPARLAWWSSRSSFFMRAVLPNPSSN